MAVGRAERKEVMSKYKYKFHAEMKTAHNCEESEVLDLVDDCNMVEADLDKMTPKQLDDCAGECWNEWFWEICNGGWDRAADAGEDNVEAE